MQGSGGAEDSPHIGGVHDALQHRHPAGPGAQLLHRGEPGPAHGAQDAPGQLIAGQPGQNRTVPGVDRHLAAPLYEAPALSLQLPALHQQREGDAARVQGMSDHLRAFRNKNTFFRLPPAAQLSLCQPGVHVQLRHVQVCHLNDITHRISPKLNIS